MAGPFGIALDSQVWYDAVRRTMSMIVHAGGNVEKDSKTIMQATYCSFQMQELLQKLCARVVQLDTR